MTIRSVGHFSASNYRRALVHHQRSSIIRRKISQQFFEKNVNRARILATSNLSVSENRSSNRKNRNVHKRFIYTDNVFPNYKKSSGVIWALFATALGIAFFSLTNMAECEENHREISYDDLELVSTLFQIDLPADKDAAMEVSFQAVFQACKEGKWALIKTLAQFKNDILSKLIDSKGRNLLAAAVDNFQYDIARKLLNEFKDVNFNHPDRDGNNPLHIAVGHGSLEFVKILSKKCDRNQVNHKKETPLHLAIIRNQSEILDYFLEIGARPHRMSIRNMELSLFELAIYHGSSSCIDTLIEKNHASFDRCPKEGGNVLHWMIHCGRPELLRKLLSGSYSDKVQGLIEFKDNEGRTPLSLASLKGDVEAIKILRQKNANLESEDNRGRRPFYLAALGKQEDAMEWLVYLGADPRAPDMYEKSPVDLYPSGSPIRIFIENLIRVKWAPSTHRTTKFYPQNLVFQGGGPKGLAYAAVIEELERQNMLKEVDRVAGTSAGAITAMLLALNYSSEEIKKILQDTDFSKFFDHPLKVKDDTPYFMAIYQSIKSIAHDPKQVMEKLWNVQTGICDGLEMRNWIEARVYEKTGIHNCTFGELSKLIGDNEEKKFKHLYVYGTKIGNYPQIVQFSSEDPKWQDIVISDTIRISASIPFVFKPAVIYQKDSQGNIFDRKQLGSFVDGGLLYNFPIETFDKKKFGGPSVPDIERNDPYFNTRTWGFYLIEPEVQKVEEASINDIMDLSKAMANIYFHAEKALREREGRDTSRSVAIPNQGISLLEFKVPKEKQELQLDAGRKATRAFLKEVHLQEPGQMYPNTQLKKKDA